MLVKNLIVMTAGALLPLAVADAKDSAPGPLEEIVVSEFRPAPLRELDSSITVLNEAAIEAASLQHFEELIALVPNMNFSGDGSRARYFQLRGIGELEQYEGAPNPSVGFIVDDIDLSGVGGISTVFDLQHAEVLRGPQATRFGANALAGLVYLQSVEPSQEVEAVLELQGGSGGVFGTGVALGGGLSDALSGRFSVHRYQADGFYENVSLGVDDSNERQELSARGKLLWDLGRGWAAKLSLLHADFDNGYDAWSPENGRTTFSDNPGRDEQRTTGGSLRISGALNAVAEFVSITGFAQSDVLFSFDGEWGDAAFWAPYVYDFVYSDQRERESFSQELRLLSVPEGRLFNGRSDWVLGLYAQRLEESDDIVSGGIYDDSADAPFSFCTPCLDDSRLQSDYESSNYALFGRLDSRLTERLSLKLGLRFERWEADYRDAFTDFIYGDPAQPLRNDFHPSENLWGGDLSLDFDLTETSRLYARIARGYKAGGFNPSLARALGASAALGPKAIRYDPETLLNVETGVRGSWLESRLDARLSLFYMDRQDMQLRSSAQFSDNPNDFVFITSNAQGHSLGLEASAAWRLNENWRLHGSLGVLDTEVDDYGLQREADIEGEIVGRDFAHAPPYSLNVGATFATPGGWTARLDLNAVDSFHFDYSHDEKSEAYRTVNLKVGREWGHWAVYGWVRNLFDEDYFTRGFSFGLEPPLFERKRFTRLGDPRHYGLSVSLRY